ncbi:nitrite reductase subunit NirD [Serratia fonticola]|uniref:Nitrite reductase subunit NirD n=1 Tax=Serratia fonticola TaxID=47917 RepID=A0A4U9WGC7_SERFO|nr:nitrite reductase subunit NirD [Serratia fonticola]
MRSRIIIVGGGTGGTILANLLAAKLHREVINNQVEIMMISDSPVHYYKPAFMYVAFNAFFKQELTRPQQSLLRPEIQFIVDKAEQFDLSQRCIYTRSGNKYHYDFLVFATGCVPWPEQIGRIGPRRAITFTNIRRLASWRKSWPLSRKGAFLSRCHSHKRPTYRTNVVLPR